MKIDNGNFGARTGLRFVAIARFVRIAKVAAHGKEIEAILSRTCAARNLGRSEILLLNRDPLAHASAKAQSQTFCNFVPLPLCAFVPLPLAQSVIGDSNRH